jgi:hypothetical protein
LFIDPQLAAGTRSGNTAASARSSSSTMRCDVSTLPPATAAGNCVDQGGRRATTPIAYEPGVGRDRTARQRAKT